MPIAVGVTFRTAGQMHYFDPGNLELHEGDPVIASTQRGLELGQVAIEAREVTEHDIGQPLRPIKRKATDDDLRREEENRERERRAFDTCASMIEKHGLPMKLIEAHYTFDRSRVVFYFGSESRVDFRKLVRDLAGELKTRVELHQVGVRDEARLFGGFGSCGRPLCCATFMSSLHPVAIKMAKEQNLALNPLKISGVCGRLMCCLNFEYEHYKKAKAGMPRMGSEITVPQGRGKIVDLNVIKGTVTVALEDDTRVEVQTECACPARKAVAALAVEPAQEPPPAAPQPQADAPRPQASEQPSQDKRPRRRRPRRRSRKPRGGGGQAQ
jgi:cell fate regulator YaaT (PSP1 superfamily)